MNRAIVIVKAGDPAFADAMERGILTARAQMTREQRAVVSAEFDRQRIAKQLHVAIGKNRGPAEYAELCFEAELAYGESLYNECLLLRAAKRVLGLYGLLVMAVRAAYRAQDRVLGGERR